MKPRPAPQLFDVLSSQRVTPNMHRVSLGGPALQRFPASQAGGYVKLMLPSADRTAVRTYTIRHHHENALDIDFALHGAGGEGGPAVSWAQSVRPGEQVLVGGPGPAKPLPPDAGYYVVAGDMTALPAIAVNLEALPREASGQAIIEIQSEADRQTIDHPPGFNIRWLVNPNPGSSPHLFEGAVRAIPWPSGPVYGWCACEFDAMRRLRRYLRDERRLGPSNLYISSYWKRGLVEDEHKAVKRADADALGV